MRSKFKVPKWIRLPIDSHPFHSISIGHPIPGIRLFKKMTKKTNVKSIAHGHIVGPTSYLLISVSFHVNLPSNFWDMVISKFELQKSRSGLWVRWKFEVTKSAQHPFHYCDVIMGTVASQITSLTIVYSTVYSDADQRKHQSYASLAFMRGIHRGPVNSPHKGPVTRKIFPFDDVIMRCISSLVHVTRPIIPMIWPKVCFTGKKNRKTFVKKFPPEITSGENHG